MTTLFERITIAPISIGVHSIIGVLREFHRGELTQQDIVDAFDLTVDQTTDLATIFLQISGSADPLARLGELFDLLVLAQIAGNHETYNDESAFWIRINGFT